MDQKFIVNGVSYDGLESMPPDVRRQYELAMEMMNKMKTGPTEKTVTRSPHGVSIKVEKRITLDEPSQLPADMNVMKVVIDNRQLGSGNKLWLWLGIAAAVVIALSFLF